MCSWPGTRSCYLLSSMPHEHMLPLLPPPLSLSLSLCAPSVKACSYTSISCFPTLVTLRGRPSFSVASTSTPLSTHGRRCLPHHLCVCVCRLSLSLCVCQAFSFFFTLAHTHSKPTKGLKFVCILSKLLFFPLAWLEFFFSFPFKVPSVPLQHALAE